MCNPLPAPEHKMIKEHNPEAACPLNSRSLIVPTWRCPRPVGFLSSLTNSETPCCRTQTPGKRERQNNKCKLVWLLEAKRYTTTAYMAWMHNKWTTSGPSCTQGPLSSAEVQRGYFGWGGSAEQYECRRRVTWRGFIRLCACTHLAQRLSITNDSNLAEERTQDLLESNRWNCSQSWKQVT